MTESLKITPLMLIEYLGGRFPSLNKPEQRLIGASISFLTYLPEDLDLRMMLSTSQLSYPLESSRFARVEEDASELLSGGETLLKYKRNGNFILCAIMKIILHYAKTTMLMAREQFGSEYWDMGKPGATFLSDLYGGDKTFSLLKTLGFAADACSNSDLWNQMGIKFPWPSESQTRTRLEIYAIDAVIDKESLDLSEETCACWGDPKPKQKIQMYPCVPSIFFPTVSIKYYSRYAWLAHFIRMKNVTMVDEHRIYWARVMGYRPSGCRAVVQSLMSTLNQDHPEVASRWGRLISMGPSGNVINYRREASDYLDRRANSNHNHGYGGPVGGLVPVSRYDDERTWGRIRRYFGVDDRVAIPTEEQHIMLTASNKKCSPRGYIDASPPYKVIRKILKKGGFRWEALETSRV